MRGSLCGLLALVLTGPAPAGEFSIDWYSINSGGALQSSAGPWALQGSLGQANVSAAPAQGGPWRLQSGFWAGFQGQAGPGLQIEPMLLDFGRQPVGEASAARTITLSNTSGSAVSLSIVVGSGNIGDFELHDSTCAGSLGAGEVCSVGVVFTPTSAGRRSAFVQVDSDAPGAPFEVLLNGAGDSPDENEDRIFSDRFQQNDSLPLGTR